MKKLALFALLASASMSFGQWLQPWTFPCPAFESRVYSCEYEYPTNVIALDDFTVQSTMFVSDINWWGTVSTPQQLNGFYYIAIYLDNGCLPDLANLIFKTCIQAQTNFEGTDCAGDMVYKFHTNHPYGTLPLGPGKYWIEIAEIDTLSVRPGNVDFRWSSCDPIQGCDALQVDYLGYVIRPLIDPCYQRTVDLAFEIY